LRKSNQIKSNQIKSNILYELCCEDHIPTLFLTDKYFICRFNDFFFASSMFVSFSCRLSLPARCFIRLRYNVSAVIKASILDPELITRTKAGETMVVRQSCLVTVSVYQALVTRPPKYTTCHLRKTAFTHEDQSRVLPAIVLRPADQQTDRLGDRMR
jgi:hypothetical protein